MRGEESENRALSFLEAQGLKLIERNWRCRGGELDLVMQDADAVVIAEVRSRGRDDFGSAAETIGPAKQAHIVRATKLWLTQRPQYAESALRFDVVALNGEADVEWLRGAFEADDDD